MKKNLLIALFSMASYASIASNDLPKEKDPNVKRITCTITINTQFGDVSFSTTAGNIFTGSQSAAEKCNRKLIAMLADALEDIENYSWYDEHIGN